MAEAGLSTAEAARLLAEHGPNTIRDQDQPSRARLLWNQLKSPLLLLLFFAAAVSIATSEWSDAAIVLTIALASAGIGYSRESRAQTAIAALLAQVELRTRVLRDGQPVTIPSRNVVPGDVVLLSAGSLVPADATVIESTDLFVNEAVLTGESLPTQKSVAPTEAASQGNQVFLGTNVRSGSARCVAFATGRATRFGAIAQRLRLRPPETDFDRGVRRFGYLLTSVMSIMVLVVFAANTLLGRPPIETLLFSIALAVGLSPELLPVILTVNLARGARSMARHGVLVRHLNAIENLGSMDVLCTDKTGTLTEGVVSLDGAFAPDGAPSAEVLEIASWNAALQTGLSNPLDEAIVAAHRPTPGGVVKLAEIPYDFVRRRMSVVVQDGETVVLVAKGAFDGVLAACTSIAGGAPLDAAARAALARRFDDWSSAGTRVLAVAVRRLEKRASYGRDDERDLELSGFLTFLDRPKAEAADAIAALEQLSVKIKLITGDSKLVACHVAAAVGLKTDHVLTGRDLDELHDDALWRAADDATLFVEVDPNQKERIILALKKSGHVVGFLGDGVNDAPAMHSADVSLSVMEAVDVAKQAADFVLLEHDLGVIKLGIDEGRKTFANTLKYVLTTTSANLGNMVSMAVASLFLPFLPLLAGQILLNNFLSDVPAIGLADDRVDPELVVRPRRWDLKFIARFMVEFGLLSSLFDFITFATLLLVFAASPQLFRTGWFVESLLTELVVALIVRTRRPFFRSRPGVLLLWSTVAMAALALAIPYLPIAGLIGFVPLPAAVIVSLIAITALYATATELAKARLARSGAWLDSAPVAGSTALVAQASPTRGRKR